MSVFETDLCFLFSPSFYISLILKTIFDKTQIDFGNSSLVYSSFFFINLIPSTYQRPSLERFATIIIHNELEWIPIRIDFFLKKRIKISFSYWCIQWLSFLAWLHNDAYIRQLLHYRLIKSIPFVLRFSFFFLLNFLKLDINRSVSRRS